VQLITCCDDLLFAFRRTALSGRNERGKVREFMVNLYAVGRSSVGKQKWHVDMVRSEAEARTLRGAQDANRGSAACRFERRIAADWDERFVESPGVGDFGNGRLCGKAQAGRG
jgi:hypothetical protein